MANKDSELLQNCITNAKTFTRVRCEHPLDKNILELLTNLKTNIGDSESEYAIYRYQDQTNELWKVLIEKAVKCLRYHDTREPFGKQKDKKPKAYGIDSLAKYFEKYSEFEIMLYGSSSYYRDHVIHVFRTWLVGIECLTRNRHAYLRFIGIDGDKDKINSAEKISIWTIIALTHDLGYPLEKARDIINKTRSMMETFVTNPDISMDLAFHGVQNYMNDFIVRLMSSKMVKKSVDASGGTEPPPIDKPYVARLQPKYYFKLQKSLEKMQHGIISTLIIYKLLTYFLESDYNIHEDYPFDEEEQRQFYIRREILRSIASHTCKDIYHLYLGSFAFLLIIADDTQEWGRKYISELYVDSDSKCQCEEIKIENKTKEMPGKCTIKDTITLKDKHGYESVIGLICRLIEQSQTYVTIFRDGQDTIRRDFNFERSYKIECGSPKITIDLTLSIPHDNQSTLLGNITYTATGEVNEKIGKHFVERLKQKSNLDVSLKVFDDRERQCKLSSNNSSRWHKGTLTIELMG